MLRRMLGKKKGKMVTFLGGHGYCYSGPSGSCSDWDVTSISPQEPMYNAKDNTQLFSISLGEQIDTSIVWEFDFSIWYTSIGFNNSKVSGVGPRGDNNPSFKYVDNKVRFKILSDFYIDVCDKYGDLNFRGEIEILPEYQA